jgi:hypothetical protein
LIFLDEDGVSTPGAVPDARAAGDAPNTENTLLIRPMNASTVPHPFRRLYREMGGRERTLFEGRIKSAAREKN